MPKNLGMDDVAVQIAVAAVLHGIVGDPWQQFSSRLGWTLPVALGLVCAWRHMTASQ